MRRRLQSLGRIVTSLAAVGVVTAGYARLIPANPTTIALSYVVVILLIATGWGIGEATAASVAAMLCFNFFFLPPVGTLTIADPQNWVALVAFLVTAIIASQLSGRARQREHRRGGATARPGAALRAEPSAAAVRWRRIGPWGDCTAHRGRLRAAGRRFVRSAHGYRCRGLDPRNRRPSMASFAKSPDGRRRSAIPPASS